MKKHLAVMIKERRAIVGAGGLVPTPRYNWFGQTNLWALLNRLDARTYFPPSQLLPLKYFVRVIEVWESADGEYHSSVGKLNCENKKGGLVWFKGEIEEGGVFIELGSVLTDILDHHEFHTGDVEEDSVAKTLFSRIHRHVKRKFPNYQYFTNTFAWSEQGPKNRQVIVVENDTVRDC